MSAFEWLEADGLGGYASGTALGVRTRRYHALLLPAMTPPTGRMVLVNGFDAWAVTPNGRFALSTQHYQPDTVYPEGSDQLGGFQFEPWPTWDYRLEDGTEIRQEILALHGTRSVLVRWSLGSDGPVTLEVRPFLSARDYHSLHHENPAFRFDAERIDGALVWRPYPGSPGIVSRSEAEYEHAPDWYRGFLYVEDRDRGLDFQEDLATPGVLRWRLGGRPACWHLGVEGDDPPSGSPAEWVDRERRRRESFQTRVERAADSYLVSRGDGRTVIAGYPWFTDWGRDTFISMRGLCLSTGRFDVAADILLAWSDCVSEGMLPNRFPDGIGEPEFNSVDASLWFVLVVDEFLDRATDAPAETRERLLAACEAILAGYADGTRHGIRADGDGLLRCGEPGVQLTWMDAKVGDWVVTPRVGKPVEVQALWLNALWAMGERNPRWKEIAGLAESAFRTEFWDESRGYLLDVADADHEPGKRDDAFRPNQIFAVGGLPRSLLGPKESERVVRSVESKLVTPMGLRTLAPDEPAYRPTYLGGVLERDGAYHQGTVWPWLMGPFVEAWLKVHGSTKPVRAEARRRFLTPLEQHIDEAGLGHLSEIAEAEPPHKPRGCPFQAWSVGEYLRMLELLG